VDALESPLLGSREDDVAEEEVDFDVDDEPVDEEP
jgi:hypothetical protein